MPRAFFGASVAMIFKHYIGSDLFLNIVCISASLEIICVLDAHFNCKFARCIINVYFFWFGHVGVDVGHIMESCFLDPSTISSLAPSFVKKLDKFLFFQSYKESFPYHGRGLGTHC